MKILAGLCLALLVSTHLSVAQEAGTPATIPTEGIIIDIRGTALFREKPAAPIQKLSRKNAIGKELHAGEELQCEAGGTLSIKMFGEKVKVLTPKLGWYPIPNLRLLSRPNPSRRAMKGQFGLAGRRRSISTIIFSPQRNGVVRPSTLVFRWVPFKEPTSVVLTLKVVGDDEPFWSEPRIEGMAGQFTSKSAMDVLMKLQRKKPDAKIEFSLTTISAQEYRTYFRVLSVKNEKSLKRELDNADKKPGFLRNVGRSYALARYQLFDDAAAEYEAALTESPESVDLLRATIRAQCEAGNRIRAEELLRRLPSVYLSKDAYCISIQPQQQ